MDIISKEPIALQSAVQQLIDQRFEEFKGTLVKDVTTQFEDQGQLLKEANRDLVVFKNAYSKAEQKNQEAEQKVQEAEQKVQSLMQQLETIEAREKRVVVLIDGDGAIFIPSLIAEGTQGGHEAASRLAKGIRSHLEPRPFKLHVYVFHNRRGLTATLRRHSFVEAATMFDDFIVGFNQADEHFAIIDAGHYKEGSDNKIRAYLDENIYSTQTLKVFFGGCHDNGYITKLNSYITSGHKEKIILLPGYNHINMGIEKLGLPSLKISNLFMAEEFAQPPVQSTADQNRVPTPTSPPGLVHPASIVKPTSYRSAVQTKVPVGSDDCQWSTNSRGLRKTNPKLVESLIVRHGSGTDDLFALLYFDATSQPPPKRNPPPCTLYYLANYCGRGSECHYGHEYDLSDDEMETLRTNTKGVPCQTILNGDDCTWGEHCIYGHVCPFSPKCHFNTAGRCRFSARGMHA